MKKMIQIVTKLIPKIALVALALSACGAPETAASTRSHEAPPTQGTMLACDGPDLPIDVKGRQGDITVTGYTYCNGLYSKDILVIFEVPNLDPKKEVFFGDRNGHLQGAVWMSDLRSSDWLSQKTSVVYLGAAPNGHEMFALRQRHVGYELPTFALRVTQGFTLQEIQF
jgi:hypothetical protein